MTVTTLIFGNPIRAYSSSVAEQAMPFEVRTATLHGHSLTYAEAGSGPVLLLIHGMGGTFESWVDVIEPLAAATPSSPPTFPVTAARRPAAAITRLGALATALRDLLLTLGHDRATLVGHSLGGGIAMQFAHQFPEIVERLVLVSSGGLGSEVSLVLRAAALPGADLFITATAGAGSRVGSALGRGLAAVGLRPSTDVAELARGYASLSDPARRKAFLATLRSVVGTQGQRVDAEDRLYLAESLPVLIVWGERDPIIPASHGRRAHEAIGDSRLVVFDGVGHLPQLEAPGRFIATLDRFLAETEPSRFDPEEWRDRLRVGTDPLGSSAESR